MLFRAILIIWLVAGSSPAAAGLYTFTDEEGVIHFTNIKPEGKMRGRWKTLFESGPGKAATVSGAVSVSGGSGCKHSRADAVPARDRDRARYTRYDAFIAEAAREYGVQEPLIRAVIKVESDYDPHVVSCAGAKGLMQIMPYEEKSEGITDIFDPRQNIRGGTHLLRKRLDRYKGNLTLTIASYHAGEGAVKKYGGVPPYKTTQQYVRMVTKQYERYSE
jgi:hypothetical protein